MPRKRKPHRSQVANPLQDGVGRARECIGNNLLLPPPQPKRLVYEEKPVP